MTNLCLFLKPQVTTPDGVVNQGRDIETFIRPAIEQAGLKAIDDQMDGLEVSDISDDLIQKVCQADVLIIDANCYETTGVFKLSHYLYYYMAFAHSRGNATILVTNTTAHLPPKLITHHTLTYSLAEIWKFINKFKVAVEGIRLHQNDAKPDNPIQGYLKDNLNQEELASARRRIAEMEAEKVRQKQGKQSSGITFRRVD